MIESASPRSFFEALLGLDRPRAFDVERRGDHADDDRALFFGDLRDDGGGTGTGATSHAGGHEHEVRFAEDLFDGALGHFGGALAHGGVAASAETLREGLADQDLRVGLDHLEVLFVRVDRDRVRAVDADVVETVDGVVTRAATADDDDARIAELVVLVVEVALLFGFFVLDRLLNESLHRYTFAQLRLLRDSRDSFCSLSISRTAERIASLRFGNSPVSTICSTSSICCFGIRSVTRSIVSFPGKTAGTRPVICLTRRNRPHWGRPRAISGYVRRAVLRNRIDRGIHYKSNGGCLTHPRKSRIHGV